MTQAELELVAGKMRDRGLHSSWLELIQFSRDVVGNLADAYQALLRSIPSPSEVSSDNPDAVLNVISNKLATALTLLTDEEQVDRWGANALFVINMPNTEGVIDSEVEQNRLRRNLDY